MSFSTTIVPQKINYSKFRGEVGINTKIISHFRQKTKIL